MIYRKDESSMKSRIYVNEIGYRPEDRKIAVYSGKDAVTYTVVNQAGERVLEKNSEDGCYNASTQDYEVKLDFTEIKEEGIYTVKVGEETSVAFAIGTDIYNDSIKALMRFFFLQRCGTELTEKYAGIYAHPVCHNTPARIYGTDTFREVGGGWHDAGDYGRYIVAAAVTLAALFHAIENDESLLKVDLQIPESGQAMPDLLAEIRYELEWMLKMQDEATGKVYHKVTCASFCGFVMPEYETEELIICPFSLTATADFAACMAMAVKFYEPYDKEFADRMADAAKKAYAVMREIQVPGGFLNPEGVVTGTYEDKNELDEQYWAAAEMYKAFGDELYKNEFENYVNQGVMHGYGWEDVASFGNLAYLSTSYPTDSAIAEKLRNAMVEKADALLDKYKANNFEISFNENDYIWGSNMYVAENGSHLFDAYKITGKEEYLEAAREHVNYIFGKNPCNVCFITGFGTNQVLEPHHRPSAATKQAMPGMLIGGPDSGLHDPDAIRDCTGLAPALCFTDKLLSYSTNEVTIYWNSALLMLMAQVLS